MPKRVLILSGPTHEYFDPVRYIGNSSSGKMGKALAEEAQKRGYTVEFVTGPVSAHNLPNLSPDRIHTVKGAEDMLEAARSIFNNADIIIFAAAVADYAPTQKLNEKLPKSTEGLTLTLRPTPDIAKTLCSDKKEGQTAIGFALQTSDGPAKAAAKLKAKKLDGIVLNTPASLGAPCGTFSFLAADSECFEEWGSIEKIICAEHIFNAINSTLSSK